MTNIDSLFFANGEKLYVKGVHDLPEEIIYFHRLRPFPITIDGSKLIVYYLRYVDNKVMNFLPLIIQKQKILNDISSKVDSPNDDSLNVNSSNDNSPNDNPPNEEKFQIVFPINFDYQDANYIPFKFEILFQDTYTTNDNGKDDILRNLSDLSQQDKDMLEQLFREYSNEAYTSSTLQTDYRNRPIDVNFMSRLLDIDSSQVQIIERLLITDANLVDQTLSFMSKEDLLKLSLVSKTIKKYVDERFIKLIREYYNFVILPNEQYDISIPELYDLFDYYFPSVIDKNIVLNQRDKQDELLIWAVKNNKILMLKNLLNKGFKFIRDSEDIDYVNIRNFSAKNNNLEMMIVLKDLIILPSGFSYYLAVKNRNYDMVTTLSEWDVLPPVNGLDKILIVAIRNNDIVMFEKMLLLFKDKKELYNDFRDLYYEAAKVNNKEIIELLKKYDLISYLRAPDDAAKSGNIDELNYLYSRTGPYGYNKFPSIMGIGYAISDGIMNTVQWLKSKGITLDKITYREFANNAANHGDLDMLKFLYDESISNGDIPFIPDYSALYEAIGNGHKDVVIWLEEKGLRPDNTSGNNAANHGQLDMVKMLNEKYNILPYNIDGVINNGYIDILEYLWNIPRFTRGLFNTNNAWSSMNTNTLNWFEKKGLITINLNNVQDLFRIMNDAVRDDNIDMVKWLYERGNYPLQEHMDEATEQGYFDMVKYIHSLPQHLLPSEQAIQFTTDNTGTEIENYIDYVKRKGI